MTRKLYAPENRLIAQIISKEEKTIGGLILPNKEEDRYVEALILDVGVHVEQVYTIDQHIMIDRYSGHHVNFDNEKYVILKEEEVLGIIWNKDGEI